MNKKSLLTVAPYIYFILVILGIFYNSKTGDKTTGNSFIILLFATPFLVQLFLKNKWLEIFLIAICLFFSSWLFLAYLSDLFDITEMTKRAWNFIVVGGLFVLANGIATSLLMRNLNKREAKNSLA
ncbi:MAG: hypothetical protein AAFZ15_07015 [Bacteroidota bacterium]